jgi:hypothetical protein
MVKDRLPVENDITPHEIEIFRGKRAFDDLRRIIFDGDDGQLVSSISIADAVLFIAARPQGAVSGDRTRQR